MLDDYHAIDAPEVHEAVTFLLDHLPDHLHLVMATRSDPPLPLARLRSRGQLTEVRAADLRFTPAEAREFLNRVMGLDLTAADVDALEERTEGWVAGLQLAALSLRGIPERGEVAGFIEAFTGSNRFVIDYLADEVLARQPAEVRDFLLRTAVLDRLTGPLCDAVTGARRRRPDAGGPRARQPLPRPARHQRSWYRYHHLFADVLRARLLAEHPDEVPGLHQRASAWYAAHDLVADAVRHALAAEDFDRAAYLMEEALPELRRARQDSLLLAWVRSLPDAGGAPKPGPQHRVRLVAADVRRPRRGRVAGSTTPRRRWPPAPHDEDLAATWADTEDLRTAPATISVYRASLAQARGDVAGTVRHARRALDLAGPEDHFVRGAGGGFLGLAAWAAGDVAGGAVHVLRGGPQPARRGEPGRRAGQHGGARRHVGRRRAGPAAPAGCTSRRCRRPPRAVSRTRGPPPTCTSGWPSSTASSTTSPSAEAHLETARVLGERASITENRHRWFVVMAQVRAAGGDYDAATRPARPGRGAVPARLLPRHPPHRRDEGPRPDRRRGPVVGRRVGRRPRRRRR